MIKKTISLFTVDPSKEGIYQLTNDRLVSQKDSIQSYIDYLVERLALYKEYSVNTLDGGVSGYIAIGNRLVDATSLRTAYTSELEEAPQLRTMPFENQGGVEYISLDQYADELGETISSQQMIIDALLAIQGSDGDIALALSAFQAKSATYMESLGTQLRSVYDTITAQLSISCKNSLDKANAIVAALGLKEPSSLGSVNNDFSEYSGVNPAATWFSQTFSSFNQAVTQIRSAIIQAFTTVFAGASGLASILAGGVKRIVTVLAGAETPIDNVDGIAPVISTATSTATSISYNYSDNPDLWSATLKVMNSSSNVDGVALQTFSPGGDLLWNIESFDVGTGLFNTSFAFRTSLLWDIDDVFGSRGITYDRFVIDVNSIIDLLESHQNPYYVPQDIGTSEAEWTAAINAGTLQSILSRADNQHQSKSETNGEFKVELTANRFMSAFLMFLATHEDVITGTDQVKWELGWYLFLRDLINCENYGYGNKLVPRPETPDMDWVVWSFLDLRLIKGLKESWVAGSNKITNKVMFDNNCISSLDQISSPGNNSTEDYTAYRWYFNLLMKYHCQAVSDMQPGKSYNVTRLWTSAPSPHMFQIRSDQELVDSFGSVIKAIVAVAAISAATIALIKVNKAIKKKAFAARREADNSAFGDDPDDVSFGKARRANILEAIQNGVKNLLSRSCNMIKSVSVNTANRTKEAVNNFVTEKFVDSNKSMSDLVSDKFRNNEEKLALKASSSDVYDSSQTTVEYVRLMIDSIRRLIKNDETVN